MLLIGLFIENGDPLFILILIKHVFYNFRINIASVKLKCCGFIYDYNLEPNNLIVDLLIIKNKRFLLNSIENEAIKYLWVKINELLLF